MMKLNVLHTEFLVHWTGRDFHIAINDLDSSIRKHYVERLVDVISNGFYMKLGSERIYGSNNTFIQATVARTCFTEIKLTQAHSHAFRYGHLGIGVHRDFVLKREGNPVFYVQNGDYSAVVENLCKLRDHISTDALKELEVALAYLKSMSEQNSPDLQYYDELEWRIVHLDRLEKYFTVTDRDKHIFRIKVDPSDIKLVVFPDDSTKLLALSDPRLATLVKAAPMFVTLDDCGNL
jgi:hypothetical protein